MSEPVPFVKYLVALPGNPLPPISAKLFEYVLASRGVFIRAHRRELSVQFCIAPGSVRGLAELGEEIELHVPRVPVDALRQMLDQARSAKDASDEPVETLFHLFVDDDLRWQMVKPEQIQHPESTRPVDDSPASSYAQALLEVHSHADLPARFSSWDNQDEMGFRLYAILGRVFHQPELRVRVGLYGYRWEIPAEWVFELPPDIRDCVTFEETL